MKTNLDSFFITSTGTEIGKTLVAYLSAIILSGKNKDLGYFKPVASDCSESEWGYRSPDEEILIRNTSLAPEDVHSSSRFEAPLSPDKAAEKENRSIDPAKLIEHYHELRSQYTQLIVEGIGGVAVPFTPEYDVSNLIRDFDLGIILVVSSTLGTISYTRTAIHYLQSKNCNINGILLTPKTGDDIEELNREHLKEFYPELPIKLLPQLNDIQDPESDTKQVLNQLLQEANII